MFKRKIVVKNLTQLHLCLEYWELTLVLPRIGQTYYTEPGLALIYKITIVPRKIMENRFCSEICHEVMHPDWIGNDKIESPDKLIDA